MTEQQAPSLTRFSKLPVGQLQLYAPGRPPAAQLVRTGGTSLTWPPRRSRRSPQRLGVLLTARLNPMRGQRRNLLHLNGRRCGWPRSGCSAALENSGARGTFHPCAGWECCWPSGHAATARTSRSSTKAQCGGKARLWARMDPEVRRESAAAVRTGKKILPSGRLLRTPVRWSRRWSRGCWVRRRRASTRGTAALIPPPWSRRWKAVCAGTRASALPSTLPSAITWHGPAPTARSSFPEASMDTRMP
mmetsp:Transcript_34587/g.91268  ORF Transcript_34587/g.91268 Transcript_34587/m.91268 type:complete len:247 (+) Transcript_34587:830-1570(+)